MLCFVQNDGFYRSITVAALILFYCVCNLLHTLLTGSPHRITLRCLMEQVSRTRFLSCPFTGDIWNQEEEKDTNLCKHQAAVMDKRKLFFRYIEQLRMNLIHPVPCYAE